MSQRVLRGAILTIGVAALAAIISGALTMACAAGDLSTFMYGDAIACVGVVVLLMTVLAWASVAR